MLNMILLHQLFLSMQKVEIKSPFKDASVRYIHITLTKIHYTNQNVLTRVQHNDHKHNCLLLLDYSMILFLSRDNLRELELYSNEILAQIVAIV